MTPDKLSLGVAQPVTKKPNKPKRDLVAFHFMILELDPICRGCDDAPSTSAHHVKYRSQGGKEIPEDGIGFCETCDDNAHNGVKIDGKWWDGRKWVLYILEFWLDDPCWRWTEVYELLKRKVG